MSSKKVPRQPAPISLVLDSPSQREPPKMVNSACLESEVAGILNKEIPPLVAARRSIMINHRERSI